MKNSVQKSQPIHIYFSFLLIICKLCSHVYCGSCTDRIICTNVLLILLVCTFRIQVECGGNCGDITPELDLLGREIKLPRGLTNGTVVYNMTLPESLGSAINVELRNNHHDFRIQKLTTYKWLLETVNACSNLTEPWIAEFLFIVEGQMCPPQFVQFMAEPTVPVFLTSAADTTLALGNCKSGQILDVYNISEAITNAGQCVLFKCSVEPENLFWVENDTIIRTLIEDIIYANKYNLEICCVEKSVDPDTCQARNITLSVNITASCAGLFVTDPAATTDTFTKSSTSNTARHDGIMGNPECFFDRSTGMAAVFSLVGNLIGATTVVLVYLLSHRCFQRRSENVRVSGGGIAS